MRPKSTLWVVALGFLHVILAEGPGQRTLHRLVGGHMSVTPELDDAEFIITSSAGAGREGKPKKSGDDGEERKTLSQQVADGKYGLIQKELFSKPVKRPGVLSYESNSEVPKDNAGNLGGLSKNDIWLAENHLLVIRGGSYPAHDSNDYGHPVWVPIDDYKAPSRQVKIPAHPKVPPPFPVQLVDGGPLQILGANHTTTLNGSFSAEPYPLSPPEGGFIPVFPPSAGPNTANATSGETPFPIPPFPPTAPFPLNGSLPPFFASLPPGAAILPPPTNMSEQFDEDDPSIYYPPPYSFHYQMDNSTQVPPGPLVPGIVLPPPPNFFAPLEKPTKKPTTTKHPKTTTTTEVTKQIYPTTTPTPPTLQRVKPAPVNHTTKLPTRVVTVYPVKYSTTTTLKTSLRKVPGRNRKRPPSVTILKPVKSTTTTNRPVYFYESNEVKPYNNPTGRSRTIISSTQVPLKAYVSNSGEVRQKTTKPPARYYFYEEEPVTVAPPKVKPGNYYLPYQIEQQPKQPFYYVNNQPSRPTSRYRFVETTKKPDTFSIHVARLKQQIHQYYTEPNPYLQPSARPVYQFSFQAANYQPQFRASPVDDDVANKFVPMNKYSVQVQPSVEIYPTESPQPYYPSTTKRPTRYYSSTTPAPEPPVATPKPISQYSFEATPNPLHQPYYTRQEERYFDDITKKYFTIFGKKIPAATTPIAPVEATTTARPQPQQYFEPNRQQQYRQPYPQVAHFEPTSLHSDVNVNYKRPRPSLNPDAEIVEAIPVKLANAADDDGKYISYELPGDDGAHFYFLTPQLAQRRDQGAGFYYESQRS